MKISKDELLKKIQEASIDEDLKISFLEDVTDSMDIVTEIEQDTAEIDTLNEELNKIKADYEELKKKYIERFTAGVIDEVPTEEKDNDENVAVVDIDEI